METGLSTREGVPQLQVLDQEMAKSDSAITKFPRHHLSLAKCCP